MFLPTRPGVAPTSGGAAARFWITLRSRANAGTTSWRCRCLARGTRAAPSSWIGGRWPSGPRAANSTSTQRGG